MNSTRGARGALRAAGAASSRRTKRGIDHIRFTAPQRAVLSDLAYVRLWRDGNQVGKSYCVAAEVVYTATNRHPWRQPKRRPRRVLVISVSHEQMVPLHEKIWELVPKDEISPKNSFDPGRGITGKPPRLVFVSGPGRGSIIQFATYKQGSTRIAGGTYDLVVLDEPPTERMYGEVIPRTLRKGGRILIAMTPTPDMPDVDWLRKRCREAEEAKAKGLPPGISEHNYGLSEENCWLEGTAAPYLTQAEIVAYVAQLLPTEREMRAKGAWEPVYEGAVLDNFDRAVHVRPFSATRLPRTAIVWVAYDHGTAANKEAIVVGASWGDRVSRDECRVHDDAQVAFLAADMIDGHATPELIVKRTKALLALHGLSWTNVDLWIGDRAAEGKKPLKRMSNRQIEIAWADDIGRTRSDRPVVIETAYKPRDSVSVGLRQLNAMLALRRGKSQMPAVWFHPHAAPLVEAVAKHNGSPKDPSKDLTDAARYGVSRTIVRQEWTVSVGRVITA